MDNIEKLNKEIFWKGFFSWFRVEDLNFEKEIVEIVSKEPRKAIKEDLKEIRNNYRSSLKECKKQLLEIAE